MAMSGPCCIAKEDDGERCRQPGIEYLTALDAFTGEIRKLRFFSWHWDELEEARQQDERGNCEQRRCHL